MFLMLRPAQKPSDSCAFVSLRDQNVCTLTIFNTGRTAPQVQRGGPFVPWSYWSPRVAFSKPPSPSDGAYLVEMDEPLDL